MPARHLGTVGSWREAATIGFAESTAVLWAGWGFVAPKRLIRIFTEGSEAAANKARSKLRVARLRTLERIAWTTDLGLRTEDGESE